MSPLLQIMPSFAKSRSHLRLVSCISAMLLVLPVFNDRYEFPDLVRNVASICVSVNACRIWLEKLSRYRAHTLAVQHIVKESTLKWIARVLYISGHALTTSISFFVYLSLVSEFISITISERDFPYSRWCDIKLECYLFSGVLGASCFWTGLRFVPIFTACLLDGNL